MRLGTTTKDRIAILKAVYGDDARAILGVCNKRTNSYKPSIYYARIDDYVQEACLWRLEHPGNHHVAYMCKAVGNALVSYARGWSGSYKERDAEGKQFWVHPDIIRFKEPEKVLADPNADKGNEDAPQLDEFRLNQRESHSALGDGAWVDNAESGRRPWLTFKSGEFIAHENISGKLTQIRKQTSELLPSKETQDYFDKLRANDPVKFQALQLTMFRDATYSYRQLESDTGVPKSTLQRWGVQEARNAVKSLGLVSSRRTPRKRRRGRARDVRRIALPDVLAGLALQRSNYTVDHRQLVTPRTWLQHPTKRVPYRRPGLPECRHTSPVLVTALGRMYHPRRLNPGYAFLGEVIPPHPPAPKPDTYRPTWQRPDGNCIICDGIRPCATVIRYG